MGSKRMSFEAQKVVFFVFFSLALLCSASDTISPGGSIADGDPTKHLVSSGNTFEFGFFSPGNSTLRYVGIWYHNISVQTVVWVANRDRPISNRTGVLSVESDGKLVIFDGSVAVWTSNVTASFSNSSTELKDDGNLILFEGGDRERPYWESFNDPTDTFLPGMKVEVNALKGENRAFGSWRSVNDPSVGNFTMGVDPRASPQIVIWEGEKRRWRSGHWNLQIFIGIPNMTATVLYGFKLVNEGSTRFFSYDPMDDSDKLRFRIEWNGLEEQLRWDQDRRVWSVMQSQPAVSNECEMYNKCGDFGICSSWETPTKCRCMDGFEPQSLTEWGAGNWTRGCRRRTQLKCERLARNASVAADEGEDGFAEAKCVKLPDFGDLVVVGGGRSCEEECLANCSCTAYADVNGIGCMIWKENLIDIQHFQDKGGHTLNVRLARSDLGSSGRSTKFIVLVVVLTIVGAALLGLFAFLLWRFKLKPKATWLKSEEILKSDAMKSKEFSTELSGSLDVGIDGSQNRSDLPLYSFNFVATSTDNFSEENKLGEGGFGHVYQGRLPGGQEIAVKRLSRKSGQGLEEFKNEIILIAKLQHRNLVRLLGCSIQGEEKMLLYEYMPNKSLDFFLFDEEKRALLDWKTRFNIIEGIARGLLYLHRDSRLRIIHRDLKASNILLDEDMNPKISDFGMARIFGGNQNELNTNRVVGTYGYMSPEYAMEGLFSVKSDVYSFGVLLLEILSGRRNTSFRNTEHLSLIGYAWNLWNEGKAIELFDPSIAGTSSQDEVLRCIQVGVLCVQDSPLYRPNMSSVVLMLESENAHLPLPRQPTFTSMRSGQALDMDLFSDVQDASSNDINASVNDITVTVVNGR